MMKTLFRNALIKADQVRIGLGINMYDPVNVLDICADLKVSVRFIDANMEGMYVKPTHGKQPSILLSNQRPFPRRYFTCAHELGHHLFGHGTRLDILSEQLGQSNFYDEDELLVDSFAGALLMPVAGVQAAFTKRKWIAESSSPLNFYTISSVFGVGFHTLIYHCRANSIISNAYATNLLKATPGKLFKSIFPCETQSSFFKIIDKKSNLSVIDLEVTNYIILPSDIRIEGDHLEKRSLTSVGIAYLAVKPGIVRIASPDEQFNSFVRIQNSQYSGLAENRYLESLID